MNKTYALILLSTTLLWQSSSYGEQYKQSQCEISTDNRLCTQGVEAPPFAHSEIQNQNNEIRITVIPYRSKSKLDTE